MARIYDCDAQAQIRNLTVAAMRARKGKRRLVQTSTVANSPKASERCWATAACCDAVDARDFPAPAEPAALPDDEFERFLAALP